MTAIGIALIVAPLLLVAYTYALYPAVLRLVAALRPAPPATQPPAVWPLVSITVPVYNEERQVRQLLESLLAIDYPPDRRQILIVSDASSDRTDEIVRSYAPMGVELLRMPQRSGKTAVENAARERLRGDIVLNTDASIRVHPGVLKALVTRFSDPGVGVASGRDVSTGAGEGETNSGEGGYVDYEMTVRQLETRVHGIVGASGCLYAIRRELHGMHVPPQLSRDFSSALNARRAGFRAVSVDDALCYVPRVPALRSEYPRKVRTITRGIQTLMHNRDLMNPFRHGVFAWMLISHKLCRWLVPWGIPLMVAGLLLLAVQGVVIAAGALVLALAGAALALTGWIWAGRGRPPRLLALLAFIASANLATLHSWLRAMGGRMDPVWEPTRRGAATTAAPV